MARPLQSPRRDATPGVSAFPPHLARWPRRGSCARRGSAAALAAAHDPIFAAIANWRSAKSAWLAALVAHDRIDIYIHRMRKDLTRRFEVGACKHIKDGEVFHEDPRFASTVEELDRHIAGAESEPIIMPIIIKTEGSELCSRIWASRQGPGAEVHA
jgi:hypothetical protein